MRTVTIIFSLFLFTTCKTTWVKGDGGDGQIHGVSSEYYQDVNRTIDKLENKMDTFAYITTIHGTCFGSSVSANSYFTWTSKGKTFYKIINKPATKEFHDIKTVSCDNSAFFNYFKTNRIDTITTLPKQGSEMIPSSTCTLKVKLDKLTYLKTFDEYPFVTSKDTLHPVYRLVQLLYSIK